MKYDSDDPRITAYVFGELEPAEGAEVEAALAASGELRELVDRTRAAIEMVRADLGGEARLHLNDRQRQTVRAEVSARAGGWRNSGSRDSGSRDSGSRDSGSRDTEARVLAAADQ